MLYRVRELIEAAERGERIWVVGSEDDAECLHANKLTATTDRGDLLEWETGTAGELIGAEACIVAGTHRGSLRHSNAVAQRLTDLGVSVRLLTLPELDAGKGIREWFGQGAKTSDLLALAERHPQWDPETAPLDLTSHEKPLGCEVRLKRIDAAELAASGPVEEPPSIPLLDQPGYVIQGWSHLLVGYPKTGKTELLYCCVLAWAKAGVRILWLTEECEDVWKHRMQKVGAPPPGTLTLVPALGHSASRLLDCAAGGDEEVVIVDTLRNLLGLNDENNNSEVVNKLSPWISMLGGKTQIYVHHSRKSDGDNGRAIAGGGALLGLVERALEIRFDPHQNANRRLVNVYSRIIVPPPLMYELRDDRLIALGSPEAVSLTTVAEKVSALSELEGWNSKAQIIALLEEPKPSATQLDKVLRTMVEAGELERDPPEGGKGKTLRYRLRELTSHSKEEPCEVRLDNNGAAVKEELAWP